MEYLSTKMIVISAQSSHLFQQALLHPRCPVALRSQVQGEYKRASLALTRSANKSGGRSSTGRDMDGVGGEDGEADGVEGPLFDLPLPSAVIETIMGQLDPVSLARAAWVCRYRRSLAPHRAALDS